MITSSRCHVEHNIETNPFQLLRKFFNVDNEYNEFKRSYPWNPMKAVSYRDWIRQLLESPVYQKQNGFNRLSINFPRMLIHLFYQLDRYCQYHIDETNCFFWQKQFLNGILHFSRYLLLAICCFSIFWQHQRRRLQSVTEQPIFIEMNFLKTQLCTLGQVFSDKADSLGVRFEFMKEGQNH